MNPKVSVMLSVYNGEKYLKEAINSILNQTFQDFELIIINDGSSDSTSRILSQYIDPRIVKISNDKNIGLVKSLNKGLEISKGEFIARMDADDESLPSRFEKQIVFLEKNKDVGVLGTAMQQIDDRGKTLSFFNPPEEHSDILKKMLFETAIAHATVMMRKDVLIKNGGYDSNFPHVEDTELWSRLILKTKFANLGEVLYKRRIHSDSVMSNHAQLQIEKSKKIRVALLQSLVERSIISREEAREIKEQINKKEGNLFFKLINTFKNLIPVPTRHKIRTSQVGKFLERIFR